jgi:hypothetical protein
MHPLICLFNVTIGQVSAAARVFDLPELFLHFEGGVRADKGIIKASGVLYIFLTLPIKIPAE